MTTVLLPNKDRNQAGAQLDPGNILEAIEYFDLQWPVEIRWSRHRHYAGVHRGLRSGRDDRRFRNEHLVLVSTYEGTEEAGKTLWHELAHAAQAEREGSMDAFKSRSRIERATVGYRSSRFEVEARAAESFNDELPLAR